MFIPFFWTKSQKRQMKNWSSEKLHKKQQDYYNYYKLRLRAIDQIDLRLEFKTILTEIGSDQTKMRSAGNANWSCQTFFRSLTGDDRPTWVAYWGYPD